MCIASLSHQCLCISGFSYICLIALYVCPLDAQNLTAALVAVEDLGLSLEQSSIEAVEELFFVSTLRQLSLDMVGGHASPLYIVKPTLVARFLSE